jgi:hypothetical protein
MLERRLNTGQLKGSRDTARQEVSEAGLFDTPKCPIYHQVAVIAESWFGPSGGGLADNQPDSRLETTIWIGRMDWTWEKPSQLAKSADGSMVL